MRKGGTEIGEEDVPFIICRSKNDLHSPTRYWPIHLAAPQIRSFLPLYLHEKFQNRVRYKANFSGHC